MNYSEVKEKYAGAASKEVARKSAALARIEMKEQRIRDLDAEIFEINGAAPSYEGAQRRNECLATVNRLRTEIEQAERDNLSDAHKEMVNEIVDNFKI